MTQERLYHADYLGPIRGEQLQHIGTFLEQGGPARVLSRLPYLRSLADEGHFSGTNAVLDRLRNLDIAVRTKIGIDQFLTVYRSHYELKGSADDWAMFQGAVSEILCADFASHSGLLNNNTLITDEELADRVNQLKARHPALQINHPSVSFRYNGILYDLPDAVEVEGYGTGATIKAIHEYKSTTDSGKDKNQFDRRIRPFFEAGPREVLKEAIGLTLELDIPAIAIPEPNQLLTRLIIAQQGLERQPQATPKFTETHIIGIPSMRNFAFFVLEILIEGIRTQVKWEDYFTEINASEAGVIASARTYRREHPN